MSTDEDAAALLALDVTSDVAVALEDETSGAEVAVEDAEVAADDGVSTEDEDTTGEEVACDVAADEETPAADDDEAATVDEDGAIDVAARLDAMELAPALEEEVAWLVAAEDEGWVEEDAANDALLAMVDEAPEEAGNDDVEPLEPASAGTRSAALGKSRAHPFTNGRSTRMARFIFMRRLPFITPARRACHAPRAPGLPQSAPPA